MLETKKKEGENIGYKKVQKYLKEEMFEQQKEDEENNWRRGLINR